MKFIIFPEKNYKLLQRSLMDNKFKINCKYFFIVSYEKCFEFIQRRNISILKFIICSQSIIENIPTRMAQKWWGNWHDLAKIIRPVPI